MVRAPGVDLAARQPRARRCRKLAGVGRADRSPSKRWPAAAIDPAEARKLAELRESRWIGGATAAIAAPRAEPAMTARRPVTSNRPLSARSWRGSGASRGTTACRAGSNTAWIPASAIPAAISSGSERPMVKAATTTAPLTAARIRSAPIITLRALRPSTTAPAPRAKASMAPDWAIGSQAASAPAMRTASQMAPSR
jgi:hypothetical protein